MRDRISEMLQEFCMPNGENEIDEIEKMIWDDISDDDLQAVIECLIMKG